MDQVVQVMQQIGLRPEMAGFGVALAILLRYGRGMLKWLNSEWTYVASLLLGVVAALTDKQVVDLREGVKEAAVVAVFVLVLQKILEKAAATVPWLPQDNEWTAPKEESSK